MFKISYPLIPQINGTLASAGWHAGFSRLARWIYPVISIIVSGVINYNYTSYIINYTFISFIAFSCNQSILALLIQTQCFILADLEGLITESADQDGLVT